MTYVSLDFYTYTALYVFIGDYVSLMSEIIFTFLILQLFRLLPFLHLWVFEPFPLLTLQERNISLADTVTSLLRETSSLSQKGIYCNCVASVYFGSIYIWSTCSSVVCNYFHSATNTLLSNNCQKNSTQLTSFNESTWKTRGSQLKLKLLGQPCMQSNFAIQKNINFQTHTARKAKCLPLKRPKYQVPLPEHRWASLWTWLDEFGVTRKASEQKQKSTPVSNFSRMSPSKEQSSCISSALWDPGPLLPSSLVSMG